MKLLKATALLPRHICCNSISIALELIMFPQKSLLKHPFNFAPLMDPQSNYVKYGFWIKMLNDPLRRVVPKPGNREGPKITDELMHLKVEAGVFFDGGSPCFTKTHYGSCGKSHKSVTLNVVPVDRQRGEVLGRFNLAATSCIPGSGVKTQHNVYWNHHPSESAYPAIKQTEQRKMDEHGSILREHDEIPFPIRQLHWFWGMNF